MDVYRHQVCEQGLKGESLERIEGGALSCV
jgi:hypothetical protein